MSFHCVGVDNGFQSLFVDADESIRTLVVDAGDYDCYVGGAAQNGAFAKELSLHLDLSLDELKTSSATVQASALSDSAQQERRIVT